MGDLFILSSVSTIKRYSSSFDMTLPIRSDLRDSNHRCSLGLDISPSVDPKPRVNETLVSLQVITIQVNPSIV